MGLPEAIEYIDMPEQLRGKYQYFTQAEMTKLAATGCPVRFTSLEDAAKDYVQGYLVREERYL
jgi:ADP-L-glycero-D-manno-heptose 6-epimerase